MATQPSIPAWEIPWTVEPTVHGGLQSMGLQKSQTQLSNETISLSFPGASLAWAVHLVLLSPHFSRTRIL